MKTSTALLSLALAATGAIGWEISFYNDECDNRSSDDSYYVYSGDGNDCVALGTNPPAGITCSYYTNGGTVGPISCDGGFTTATRFYASGNCYLTTAGPACIGQGFGTTDPSCQQAAVQSFSCTN